MTINSRPLLCDLIWEIANFLGIFNTFLYLIHHSWSPTGGDILELILNNSKAKLSDNITELSHVSWWEKYIGEKNIP